MINSSPQIHAGNAYIEALSKFKNDGIGSFANLLAAIKALVVSFEIWRPDEFSALLWTFPSTRRDLFPYSQYKMNDSKLQSGRVDVLLLSHDQTLFAITVKGRQGALSSLKCVAKHLKNMSTSLYPFKSGTPLVQHRVLIGLGYAHSRAKGIEQVAGSFMRDTFDLSRATSVTV